MSRTDKDLPYWLRCTWWEPQHSGCRYAAFVRGRSCDLPAEPVRQRPVRATWKTRTPGCTWRPSGDHFGQCYRYAGAFRQFVTLEFTRPQRRRVRDELTRCRQEHRATGAVDTVVATAQHRHLARWDWW